MDIIQNAVQVVSTGRLIVSGHRHDYVGGSIDERVFAIDGGCSYFRSTGALDELIQEGKLLDLRLTDENTVAELADKCIWGTLGPGGHGPHRWVFLKDCETQHLEYIETNPRISKSRNAAIKLILERRKNAS
jgi:hypothetical protein